MPEYVVMNFIADFTALLNKNASSPKITKIGLLRNPPILELLVQISKFEPEVEEILTINIRKLGNLGKNASTVG